MSQFLQKAANIIKCISCTGSECFCRPEYIHSSLHCCQLVAYGSLKTKENFKLLAIKVVAVAYERWLLTRGSKYGDLTCKLLVFWKTSRLGEVVAYERLSQPEVRLY